MNTASLSDKMESCFLRRSALLLVLVCMPATVRTDAETPYQITERGPFHRVWQRTVTVKDDSTGEDHAQDQRYTELANGLHYWEGEWKESQDLIELAPDGEGAWALRGPSKVIFSPNLNTPGAIDLLSASGRRFRHHLLGLYYFDAETGESVRIAGVADSIGELVPPNQVVYRNCLGAELKADAQFIYTRGGFEANLVLLEKPAPPEHFGLKGDSTRLEIWWEVLDPPPVEKKMIVLKAESDPVRRARLVEPDLIDEMLLFDDLWFPIGKAFVTEGEAVRAGQAAEVRLPDPSGADGSTPVGKRLLEMDGHVVLVESVDWYDLEPKLKGLKQAAVPREGGSQRMAAVQGRRMEERRAQASAPAATTVPPMQVAQVAYAPKGVVLDYVTLTGGASSYTFQSGQTYYVPDAFGVGSYDLNVQAGSVVKLANNAYLYTFGPIYTPASGAEPVFTSRDDNLFGEAIAGNDGIPGYDAAQAWWVYYVDFPTEIRNVRFRWAKQALRYDTNPGVQVTHTVRDCQFDQSQTGIYLYYSSVSLINVKQCDVQTPVSIYCYYYDCHGSYTGAMTVGCGELDISRALGNESEPDIAINPNDPNQVFALAVPFPKEAP